ncbi:MAG: sterol desaturase family protein [Burkholderiaceae bacterium]|nr:sterol desaturase family protein [Burkholderiaceae bacterium]
MMQEKIITLASPIFFVLIAIEFWLARKRQKHLYRINDAINSLSLGVISQITGVFLKILPLGIYAWILDHAALWSLPKDQWWVWVSGLLLYDFLYYWLHRMGHETNLLWAAHVVHHQSEEYNLTTALRQTSSGGLFGWIFYLPMAVLGFPLDVFIIIALIDLLYQFWIHTQQIDKLGWFDRVFVSPSNHRVHHAVNDQYLDKNYGGILILWDRLFGTFMEEQANNPVVFGTRSPLRSWNPVWANLEVYQAVALDAWRARSWWDKCRIWLMPPGWKPAELFARYPGKPFDIQRPIYDPPLRGAAMWYCLIQFTICLQIGTHFLTSFESISITQASAYGFWLTFSFFLICGLMEKPAIFAPLEKCRLLVTMILVSVEANWFSTMPLSVTMQILIGVYCIASFIATWKIFPDSGIADQTGQSAS